MSTFVLVHGAWHGAWCWSKLIPLLKDSGHTVVAPDLPAHGEDRTPAASVSMDSYVARVTAALDSCNEPVQLVGHSMGGAVVSQAAEARAERLGQLVYVSAFLLPGGTSLGDEVSREAYTGALSFELDPDGTSSRLKPEALAVLYDGCAQEDIERAQTLLGPEPLAPLAAPLQITSERWGRVPRTYIECIKDRAIPLVAQRAMQNAVPCQRVVTLRSGHSPFLSMPAALAGHLMALAGGD